VDIYREMSSRSLVFLIIDFRLKGNRSLASADKTHSTKEKKANAKRITHTSHVFFPLLRQFRLIYKKTSILKKQSRKPSGICCKKNKKYGQWLSLFTGYILSN